MLSMKEIIAYLEHMNLSAVARDSGVKYAAIWRISQGKKVTYDTVEKLSDYIEKRIAKNKKRG